MPAVSIQRHRRMRMLGGREYRAGQGAHEATGGPSPSWALRYASRGCKGPTFVPRPGSRIISCVPFEHRAARPGRRLATAGIARMAHVAARRGRRRVPATARIGSPRHGYLVIRWQLSFVYHRPGWQLLSFVYRHPEWQSSRGVCWPGLPRQRRAAARMASRRYDYTCPSCANGGSVWCGSSHVGVAHTGNRAARARYGQETCVI